jgi:hypothetical protein
VERGVESGLARQAGAQRLGSALNEVAGDLGERRLLDYGEPVGRDRDDAESSGADTREDHGRSRGL